MAKTPTPKYITNFDDITARKRWLERHPPLAGLFSWIPKVFVLQQQRVHDLVGLTIDKARSVWVTCSCGLAVVVPEEIAGRYLIPPDFLYTYQFRDWIHDAQIETWFYSRTGHRDPFYGSDTRAFVALYADRPNGGPRRQLVCTVCRRELEFRFSGKFALFRPDTYAKAVSDHLSECSGVSTGV